MSASARMFARFLVSGGINTAVTYALYLALLRVLPYLPAYVIAFVSGVILSYVLNRVFVFRTNGTATTVVLFPFVYVIQLVAGALTAAVWVDGLHLPSELAPLAAIAVTVPLTYALSKWLFLREQP